MYQGQDPAVCCAIPSRTVEVSLSLEQWLPLVGREGGWGVKYSRGFTKRTCPDAQAEGGGGFGKGNSSREQKHERLPLLGCLLGV